MSSGQQGNKARILLVEDNPGDVELLRLAFRAANLDCELAVIEDGAAALVFLSQFRSQTAEKLPDLMILDLNLPRNDGLEILEFIRGSGAFVSMPVVVLTSSFSHWEFSKLESLGIYRHMTKPGDLQEFMAIGPMIQQILEEHR